MSPEIFVQTSSFYLLFLRKFHYDGYYYFSFWNKLSVVKLSN